MGIRLVSMHVATAIAVVQFLAVALSCRHPNEPIPPNLPDTTSHAFAWQEWEFGDGGGYSSDFEGATIVDDSIVYVTGGVYLLDSTGQVNTHSFNLARWTAETDWHFFRLEYFSACGQRFTASYPTRGILATSKEGLWVSGKGPGIARFDGLAQRDTICGANMGILSVYRPQSELLLCGGYFGRLSQWSAVPVNRNETKLFVV